MCSGPPEGLSLGELSQTLGAELRGDPQARVARVAELAEAGPSDLAFFSHPRFKDQLASTRAGAVLLRREALELAQGRAVLIHPHPALAFARAAALLNPPPRPPAGVDGRAAVDPSASIDPTASVLAFAFVGPQARVGARAVLSPFAYVGAHAEVGEDAVLHPGAVLLDRCRLGARGVLHAGAVVGADGFGYIWDSEAAGHVKVPQVGTVEIDEDVEIGANAAVDRATLSATRVGRGTKIDNLVQVGHNVQIERDCILCGQSGVAGSARLGPGSILGGQSGVSDHVTVAPGTRLGMQSGAYADLEEPGTYMGLPAIRQHLWFRAQVAARRAPELEREVRALRARVQALEARLRELAPEAPPAEKEGEAG